MKKLLLIFIGILFSFNLYAGFLSSYNYITKDELVSWIKSKKVFHLVDIQVKKDFDDEHIVGAIPTYAFPVKTDSDKQKLDPVIAKVKADNSPIVIVCPSGKIGAERAYDYMKSKGIDEKRLLILKGGMGSWTYSEYSEPK